MKASRNDPCPCGSGKKYKKCCLAKDEAAAPAHVLPPNWKDEQPPFDEPTAEVDPSLTSLARPEPAEVRVEEPPDPMVLARDERWEEFEASDYARRAELFEQTLAEPELMDAELAFEMIAVFCDSATNLEQWAQAEQLIHRLREQHPALYQPHEGYYLAWQLESALAHEDEQRAAVAALMLARRADVNIDLFHDAVDRIAFRGDLALLLEMLRIAWPLIKDSKDVVPWAIDEYAQRAVRYELFDYLVAHPDAQGDEPELVARLTPYVPEPQNIREFVEFFSGRREAPPGLADPQSAAMLRRRNDETLDGELWSFGTMFVGYLYRHEHAPLPTADMAREQIVRYLLERQSGELRPQRSMIDQMTRPDLPPLPAPRRPEHPLCPDRTTFELFLTRSFGVMSARPYEAAIALLAVPAWLRFLQSRGLIEDDLRQRTIKAIQPLVKDLHRLLEKRFMDPALRQALSRWGGGSELILKKDNTAEPRLGIV